MSLRNMLKGTGVAVVTTFKEDRSVDFEAYERLLENLISNKVEYIVTLGTTGEAPVLSAEEKIAIVECTYNVANGRVPVVVGIGGNHTDGVIAEIKRTPLNNAAAVLSSSPYYNKPSQEGIFQHYKAIAEACPVPVLLYNVPGRTGRNVESRTTLRLAAEVDNIAGIKEASGDMAQCMAILKEAPPNFLVVSGDDALALPQLACGMDGVISVAANAFPKEFGEMVRSCLAQNFSEAKKINDGLLEAYDLMFCENNPAGIKAFLYETGQIKNILRLPEVPLSGQLQQRIKSYLERR